MPRLAGRPRACSPAPQRVWIEHASAFREDAAADRPLAPYPASKRSMELMAHSHHHLFKLPMTIVRFFNVYDRTAGRHGAVALVQKIQNGKPIELWNSGKMKRDWTYIDDIVAGFVAALDHDLGFEILNLGCSNPGRELRLCKSAGRSDRQKAVIEDKPAPATEPIVTYADVSKAKKLIGYEPRFGSKKD